MIEWLEDVSAARWVAERLHPFAIDVGSFIPPVFEAYARVFHPEETEQSRAQGTSGERWASIAARNGRIAHADMQLQRIACPRGGEPPAHLLGGPISSSLPLAERAALVELLAASGAAAPLCWFCVWEGYGGLDPNRVTARVELPHRRYLLYRGPLSSALASLPTLPPGPRARSVWYDSATLDRWRRSASPPPSSLFRWPASSQLSPNLWWPDDRSWCVTTEVDHAWTYVGGSHDVIQRVLSHPALEALATDPSARHHADGDRLNQD